MFSLERLYPLSLVEVSDMFLIILSSKLQSLKVSEKFVAEWGGVGCGRVEWWLRPLFGFSFGQYDQ